MTDLLAQCLRKVVEVLEVRMKVPFSAEIRRPTPPLSTHIQTRLAGYGGNGTAV